MPSSIVSFGPTISHYSQYLFAAAIKIHCQTESEMDLWGGLEFTWRNLMGRSWWQWPSTVLPSCVPGLMFCCVETPTDIHAACASSMANRSNPELSPQKLCTLCSSISSTVWARISRAQCQLLSWVNGWALRDQSYGANSNTVKQNWACCRLYASVHCTLPLFCMKIFQLATVTVQCSVR